MAFVVVTESEDPFLFDGQIGGNKSQIVFKGAAGVRIFKTGDILAIMRPDFAEAYNSSIEELKRLKFGNPEHN